MRFKIYSFITVFCLLGGACKKVVSIVNPVPISSLTVVNAVDGSSPMETTFWPDSAVATFYSTTPEVGYTSSQEYDVPSGQTPVIIYQSSDTSAPFFQGNVTFQPTGIYSLFLSGPSNVHSGPDTLLVLDNPPNYPVGDSVMGIRFVNVSPDAGTISVDIQGEQPGSEVTSLAYKGVTSFKTYTATSTVPNPSIGYVFEFRSVANDSLLCSYNYSAGNLPEFHSVSLVLSGTIAGSGIQVFEYNNY